MSVVHALPHTVWQRTITLARGSTIQEALTASGFFEAFPELDRDSLRTGIHGRQRSPNTLLQPQDRVEIYRPLVFDPMESRRRRARHKENKRRARRNKAP